MDVSIQTSRHINIDLVPKVRGLFFLNHRHQQEIF